MTKKHGIDAQAEDILRLLDNTPETPGDRARAALQQAADAGGGMLRQQHLQEAQAHIARIDPRRNAALVQQLQAQVLALQGRGGDMRIAHVTPGEIVIPHAMQTPDFVRLLAQTARDAGLDPATLFVASGRNSVNPRTGMMEFDDDDDQGGPANGPPAVSDSDASDSTTPPVSDHSISPQTGMEGVTVTAQRPFQLTDILPAAKILEGEAGGQLLDVKRQVMQAMLSRVGSGDGSPQTLSDVMYQKTKGGHYQFNALDHQKAFFAGGGSMAPADARSWDESLNLAHDMITDAMNNGVDYGNRFFGDAPPPKGSPPGTPHTMEFYDPAPNYRKPYPK